MEILYLNHNVSGQGTFQRAFGFARNLAARGHEVTLLTTSVAMRRGHREAVRRGVRVIETPDLLWGKGRTGWDLWNTAWRINFVRRRHFDLVHAFDSRPAVIFPALYAKHRSGCPLIIDWCDWWGRGGTIQERSGWLVRTSFGPIETFFEEAFRNRADGTTVISAALAERAAGLGVPPDRIARLLNGADLDRISPVDKAEARKKLGLPRGEPIIGYLGTLARTDAALLYDSFRFVRAKAPDCRLLVIGRHNSQIPAAHREGDALIETGYVPARDLPYYLGACDLLILPMKDSLASRARWPGKVGDYLAAGRPIVACAVGEAAVVLADCPSVTLTPDRPEEFGGAILSWLQRRDSDGLAIRSRQLAESRLSWQALAEQLEHFYEQISYWHAAAAGRVSDGGQQLAL